MPTAVDPSSAAPPRGARIVLASFGSLGDLHPYLALALALRSRGHVPIVAATDIHRDAVEAEGFEFRRLRPDKADFGDERAAMKRALHRTEGPEFLVRQVLSRLHESYDDLDAACAGADLLVSHPFTFAAPLVAERRRAAGLAWASVAIAPTVLLSAFDPPVFAQAPWLRRLRWLGPGFHRLLFAAVRRRTRGWMGPWHALRRDLGLPPTDLHPLFEAQFSPELVLALFSPLLAAPQPDWPARTVVTGFPVYDRRSAAANVLDPALAAFLDAGEPPVVFTLGSAAVFDAGGFYAHSAEAARRLGRRAVLLVGADERNRLGLAPSPQAMLAEYAPHSLLFPRAAAIVHHGGVGTTAQALRAGRPALVVPFGFDQFDNAHRAARLGTARVVPRSAYGVGSAVRALRALLDEPRYAERARDVAPRIAAEDGAEAACDALERLLAARRAPGGVSAR